MIELSGFQSVSGLFAGKRARKIPPPHKKPVPNRRFINWKPAQDSIIRKTGVQTAQCRGQQLMTVPATGNVPPFRTKINLSIRPAGSPAYQRTLMRGTEKNRNGGGGFSFNRNQSF
ncbi:hypothetical protein MTP99_008743 [Tenebrio molitor]|nr:hypothetical protein MTP99_008743 [Tenebrio molitor]